MEKQAIIELLKNMNTAKGLAVVLNTIKHKEFGSIRYSISEKMLRHFSSDSIAPKRFRKFHIRKKSGGLREIKAPCQQLDVILTCVNTLLKSIYEPSDVAMGFTSGRSVLNNAQIHVGHNYVFNIDLKDFFPSIPQARVWKRLQLAPFNFSEEIANILAGICCCYDANAKANVLPQGSPASPLLTNAICDKLDRRMKGVARRFGLHYSRYADDMTFSSMHNVYQKDGVFRTEISRIITEQGFQINESKTRLQKSDTRQEVTGLTVNTVANVNRKYISDLRWIMSVWEKEGYAKAFALFYPKYKHDKGYIKKGEPVMENVIKGKLDYLRMVRGESNPAYRKLAARYAALQGLVLMDIKTYDTKSYVYVQPYPIVEFQDLFHTIVSLEISREGKVIGKCTIDNREKILAISKSTQKILCPDLEDKSAGETVYSEYLDKCYVTLCRNKGKNFWLITNFEPKRSRCLSFQDHNVSPCELLALWGKENLLKHFLKKRQHTLPQEKTLMRLLLASIPTETLEIDFGATDIEHLISIWEKDGLDAAVMAWKQLANEKKPNSPKTKANAKNRSSQNTFIEDPGISVEGLNAIQQEIAEGGGTFIDLGMDWDDVPFDDDSIILESYD